MVLKRFSFMDSEVTITEVDTTEIRIYCGLKRMYTGIIYPIDAVYVVLEKYVNEKSWCVSLTPTQYVYKGGTEPGVIIGLINYPRFPASPDIILQHAFDIAKLLMYELFQYRVTVVTNTKTYMLSNPTLL